jgi:hypothetical protein
MANGVTPKHLESLHDGLLEMTIPEKPNSPLQKYRISERIVADIDEIVKKVRQHTSQGERLVQRELRRTLLKYKLRPDHDLFDKAYGYIRQYD